MTVKWQNNNIIMAYKNSIQRDFDTWTSTQIHQVKVFVKRPVFSSNFQWVLHAIINKSISEKLPVLC